MSSSGNMFDKLKQVEVRFEDLERQLADPQVLSDGAVHGYTIYTAEAPTWQRSAR